MKKIILIILLFLSIKPKNFNCRKLFEKDYKLFEVKADFQPFIKRPIKNFKEKKNEKNISGYIILNPCKEITTPQQCGIKKNAKLIFVPNLDSKKKNCTIIELNKKNNNWEYEINLDNKKRRMVNIKQIGENLEYKLIYSFICKLEKADKPEISVEFDFKKKLFSVKILSEDGCVTDLNVFRFLFENKNYFCVFFLALGIFYLFFGFFIFKEYKTLFCPLFLLIGGFYFYLVNIESTKSFDDKFNLIVGIIFIIVLLTSLMIIFQKTIFLFLNFFTSYQIFFLMQNILEKEIGFKMTVYTKILFFGCIFFSLFFIFYKIQDFFIITSTSLIGAIFIGMTTHNVGLIGLNILFDIGFHEFGIIVVDRNYYIFFFLIIFITLIGINVQLFVNKKKDSKALEKEELV